MKPLMAIQDYLDSTQAILNELIDKPNQGPDPNPDGQEMSELLVQHKELIDSIVQKLTFYRQQVEFQMRQIRQLLQTQQPMQIQRVEEENNKTPIQQTVETNSLFLKFKTYLVEIQSTIQELTADELQHPQIIDLLHVQLESLQSALIPFGNLLQSCQHIKNMIDSMLLLTKEEPETTKEEPEPTKDMMEESPSVSVIGGQAKRGETHHKTLSVRTFKRKHGQPGATQKRQNKRQQKRRKLGPKQQQSIMATLLTLLTTIKLFHWNTRVFAQHKAADETYTKLQVHVDSFVEILMSLSSSSSSSSMNGENKESRDKDIKNDTLKLTIGQQTDMDTFGQTIDDYKHWLTHEVPQYVDSTDLLNLRDEMLADLNQFVYLLLLT